MVEDGTVITYTVQDLSTGKILSLYTGMTINGVSTIYIQNPKVARSVKIFASHYGHALSEAIELSFNAYVSDFILIEKDDTIETEPIKVNTGQLIADGTVGLAEVLSTGEVFESESLDGQFIFKIDPSYLQTKEDVVKVTIGGISKSIVVNYGEAL